MRRELVLAAYQLIAEQGLENLRIHVLRERLAGDLFDRPEQSVQRAVALGARVYDRTTVVRTHAEDGFRLHAEAFLAAFTPRTRGIIINSPGNPTGALISEEDLAEVARECAHLDQAHAMASSRSVVAIGRDAARSDGYTPAAIPERLSIPSDIHAAFG